VADGARRAYRHPSDDPAALALLLRRFPGLGPLEIEQIQCLELARRRWRPGMVMLGEGQEAHPYLLLSGWVSRQRVLSDGRRLIFDLLVPGDGFGFAADANARARRQVVAVTAVETVDAEALAVLARECGPEGRLAQAMAALQREDEARLMESMVRLGRLTALEKVSHFLLEMERRTSTGPGELKGFRLPLTQQTIGDALGLSIVHVNRVLRHLRGESLVSLQGGFVRILDPLRLAALAALEPPERAARGSAV